MDRQTIKEIDGLECCPTKGSGGWRACLYCKLIKGETQWMDNACENCPQSEGWGDIESWTTPSFTGVIALMDDRKSWVAKHQRIINKVPGLYAIQLKGKIKTSVESDDEDFDV